MNFTRVNAVTVFGSTARTSTGLYLDASLFPGGANAAEVVPITGPTAQDGMLYRGQPAFTNPATGKICSPQASGAVFRGVLVDDISASIIAKAHKVTFQTADRCRTYAGATLAYGQFVKADTSASYCGFVPWVQGTDVESLKAGRAYPLDDGSASNGASAAVAMIRGDQIFLDLRPQ